MSVCSRFDPITPSSAPSCAVCSQRGNCLSNGSGPGMAFAYISRRRSASAARRLTAPALWGVSPTGRKPAGKQPAQPAAAKKSIPRGIAELGRMMMGLSENLFRQGKETNDEKQE